MADKIKPKKAIWKKWWFWLIAILVIIVIASASGGEKKETTPEQQLSQGQVQPQETPQTSQEGQKESAEEPPVTEGQPEQEQEQEKPACEPSQEICDGIDNDCDGLVDENLTQQCGTSDVGACKFGTKACQNGVWGKCIGAINPTNEICDQKDNDCDGQIDEGDVCTPLQPEPINLSGSGQQASQKFILEGGLSIFYITHSGQGHFAIELLDNNGQYVELLVNEIGSFNGAKAVGIESKGTYLLDISADSQWSVRIEQPRLSTAPSVSKTFTGSGQQVSEMFSLNKGLTVFRITHNGSGHFAIEFLDENGGYVELLVNEIGSFDGSKAVGIPSAGIYLLDISADGNWSVTIE